MSWIEVILKLSLSCDDFQMEGKHDDFLVKVKNRILRLVKNESVNCTNAGYFRIQLELLHGF